MMAIVVTCNLSSPTPSRQQFNIYYTYTYTYTYRPPLTLAANRSCTGGSEFARLRPERPSGSREVQGEMARHDMRVQGPLNSNSDSTRRDGEFEVERGKRPEARGRRKEEREREEGRKRRRLRSAARSIVYQLITQ